MPIYKIDISSTPRIEQNPELHKLDTALRFPNTTVDVFRPCLVAGPDGFDGFHVETTEPAHDPLPIGFMARRTAIAAVQAGRSGGNGYALRFRSWETDNWYLEIGRYLHVPGQFLGILGTFRNPLLPPYFAVSQVGSFLIGRYVHDPDALAILGESDDRLAQ